MIMLASCSKKQMQLEFMFSSLSEKRNQSKLPSKSCGVIQIPPIKICNRKQEPGNGRTEIHMAAVAPLPWGWQLRGSAFRLKGTSVLSSVSQNCDYHNLQEAEEWPVWGGRQEPLGRVGRGGISDSATSSGNPSPAGLSSSLTLWIVSWLACQQGKQSKC